MADKHILIGPGKIYYAPVGEANPDDTTIDFGEAWGGNWADLGDFLEGNPVVLSMPEEMTKVYTERSTAPKNAVRTRREPIVKATLAEHSPTNMALVLSGTATPTAAGAAQKAVTDITFGTGSEVDFYKWGIEAFMKDDNDTPQPVRWFLHKGFIKLAGDTSYAKQNPTGIPIEITIFGDGSQAANAELGTLQFVTGPATT